MDRRITPRSPRAALEPEHVPVPTRRSKRARNPLVIVGNAIFTLLILLVIGGGGAVVFGKHRFEAPGPLQEDKVVNIPPRAGMIDIADLLQREGVIDEHRLVFIGGVFALKARSELKSGEYLFPKHASLRDVVETIVEGKVVQHLAHHSRGADLRADRRAAAGERHPDRQHQGHAARRQPAAGHLPLQPRHHARADDPAHAAGAAAGWCRKSGSGAIRDLPLQTPEQLVILASIIEKETGKPEERTRVAAVFVNRLKQKMKLQSDPTIIYGLVGGKGTLGRPITRSEIEQPTPYNTYVIDGLPPGPIANPGRASIEAAANPARTKELFFVADGTGGHAFAETYDQHQKNVARLRVDRAGRATPAPHARAPAPDARRPRRRRRRAPNEPQDQRGEDGSSSHSRPAIAARAPAL